MTTGTALTGPRVWLVCLLAAAATAVVPPATARWWHAQRVELTRTHLRDAAQRAAALTGPADLITCGQGRRPGLDEATAAARDLTNRLPTHAAWLARMTVVAAFTDATPPDAWGQCLVWRVSADGRTAVLLSAGANGLIETRLDAVAPSGDDLLERVR